MLPLHLECYSYTPVLTVHAMQVPTCDAGGGQGTTVSNPHYPPPGQTRGVVGDLIRFYLKNCPTSGEFDCSKILEFTGNSPPARTIFF